MRRITANPALCFAGCLLLGLAGIGLIGRLIGPNTFLPMHPDAPAMVGPPQAPVAFYSKEGKSGWSVVIPGNHALATPAIADGKLFLGGGFGSFEFYAFDAKTGRHVWTYRTGDDGPTAAVVEDGYVAFNTESCELEVLTTDGKRVWKKWLGDPLMSMPAISQGRVYMAYPDTNRDGSHYVACFDVKSGREYWRQRIAGEVVTAPTIDGDNAYLTTLEGTLYCFDRTNGQLVWSEKKNATSSPAVWNGRLFFSQREAVAVEGVRFGFQQKEQLVYKLLDQEMYQALAFTARHADYLDSVKRKELSLLEPGNLKADTSVGFSQAPLAAKLDQAMSNLGQATVAGVWSYQGSRPFVYRGKLYSSMGDTVQCVDLAANSQHWAKSFPQAGNQPLVDAALTPPAFANGKMFIGSRDGQVVCLQADTGEEIWRATIGEPIVFQPVVAYGRVFVSTNSGRLFCVETGDEADHGWLMWGGGAAHNGAIE